MDYYNYTMQEFSNKILRISISLIITFACVNEQFHLFIDVYVSNGIFDESKEQMWSLVINNGCD